MGNVIRPAAFARGAAAALNPPRRRIRPASHDLTALILAVAALAWIIALAGAAFAVRATLVLCFATLAGRVRRVGTPPTIE